MSIDWGAVLTGAVTAIITAAIGSILVSSTRVGQSFWAALGRTAGSRMTFALAVTAIVIAIGALVAVIFREQHLVVERGGWVQAAKNKTDVSWAAEGACLPGTILIGYYCEIEQGGGNLQNLGFIRDGTFHCLWNNVTQANFRARGQAICAQLSN
jgi:hypothetical protein